MSSRNKLAIICGYATARVMKQTYEIQKHTDATLYYNRCSHQSLISFIDKTSNYLSMKQLVDKLRKAQPHILHVHTSLNNFSVPAELQLLGIPTVMDCHDNAHEAGVQEAAQAADAVITTCYEMGRELGISEFTTVYSKVPEDWIEALPDAPNQRRVRAAVVTAALSIGDPPW